MGVRRNLWLIVAFITSVSYALPEGCEQEPEPTLAPDCPGCASEEREVDERLQDLFDIFGEELSNQAQHIAQASGVNAIFVEFVPLRYRRQWVAGRNYYVKVRVAAGIFSDVLIFEPLKCTNADPEVEFVRFGVPEDGAIDPFWRPREAGALQEKPCRGCPSDESEPDDRLLGLLERNGADLQSQALLAAQAQGMNAAAFEDFTPLRYRLQLVAGRRYFVKLRVMAREFIDVLIFESPHRSVTPRVIAVRVGVAEDAPIDPFDHGIAAAIDV